MNTATTARVPNRAVTVLHVSRKRPSLRVRIRVRARRNPDAIAMTVARAQRLLTRKVVTTTANRRVILKKITNHVPTRTWVHKAV